MKPQIVIENRAKGRARWPDLFVREVAEWLARRGQIDWPYRIEIKNTAYETHARGRAWKRVCNLTIHRRTICRFQMEHRFKTQRHLPGSGAETATQAFVYLLAHEMRHAQSANWEKSRGWSREFDANRWGREALADWKTKVWPKMRRKIIDRLKQERRVAEDRRQRERERKAAARTTEAKLAKSRSKLEEWEAKVEHAMRYVKKYRRSVSALEAAIRRKERLAAQVDRQNPPGKCDPPWPD